MLKSFPTIITLPESLAFCHHVFSKSKKSWGGMVGKAQAKSVLITKKGQGLFSGPEGKGQGKAHIHIFFILFLTRMG